MLTTESRYDLNRGRAQNSNTSGLTAPIDFAGFFISTLKSRECEEYPNNSACLVSRFELPTPYGLREQSSQKGILDMKNQLIFKSQTLTPVIVNNLPYLRVPQIEGALNYRSGKLLQIYNRHADEFTPEMSFLTTIDTKGGKQQVRVFSLRGCHLLAMFSKTPVAKEFRKWVLDLIEQHNQVVSQISFPELSEFSSEDRQFIQSILAYGVKKYKQGKITGTLDAILDPRLANLSQQLIGENND